MTRPLIIAAIVSVLIAGLVIGITSCGKKSSHKAVGSSVPKGTVIIVGEGS